MRERGGRSSDIEVQPLHSNSEKSAAFLTPFDVTSMFHVHLDVSEMRSETCACAFGEAFQHTCILHVHFDMNLRCALSHVLEICT